MTSGPERIAKIIEDYDKQISTIKSDIMRMCWYMRGGVSYEEAMNMSYKEREIIGDIVKENLETTKKTGMTWV